MEIKTTPWTVTFMQNNQKQKNLDKREGEKFKNKAKLEF